MKIKVPYFKQEKTPLVDPAILYGGVQGFGHFVVITGLEKGKIFYHDPDMKKDLSRDIKIFYEAWEKFSFKGVKIWKSMKKQKNIYMRT